MLHIAAIIMGALWTGFSVIGLGEPIWGALHWFGLFGVGVCWCVLLAMRSLVS